MHILVAKNPTVLEDCDKYSAQFPIAAGEKIVCHLLFPGSSRKLKIALAGSLPVLDLKGGEVFTIDVDDWLTEKGSPIYESAPNPSSANWMQRLILRFFANI